MNRDECPYGVRRAVRSGFGNARYHIFFARTRVRAFKAVLLRFAPLHRTPRERRSYEKIQNDRTYSLVYEFPDVCLSLSSLYGDHLFKLLQ